MQLRLGITRDYDQSAALALWGRAATASVFNHPAWVVAALAAFGAERRLHVLSLYRDAGAGQGERLVGLWPLWFKRLGAKEGFTTILEPVGARVTDYVMPLIAAEIDLAAALRVLLGGATDALGATALLLWPKSPGAARVPVQQASAELGLLTFSRDRPCPVMALGSSYAALEQSWTKSHRGDVRRQTKRLAKEGDVTFYMASSRAEIMTRLPHLYAMHTQNWGSRTGFSEFEHGPMTTFVAQLAAELPFEMLHYSELRLNDRPLSCHFGFRDQGGLLWYKPTYDIAAANFAPGKLHIARAAAWGIENGCDKIDFLQGTEPYKLQWANTCNETTTWAIARRVAYPFWVWNTTIRNLAAEYHV